MQYVNVGTRETPLSLFNLTWPRCNFSAIFCGHKVVCCTPLNLLHCTICSKLGSSGYSLPVFKTMYCRSRKPPCQSRHRDSDSNTDNRDKSLATHTHTHTHQRRGGWCMRLPLRAPSAWSSLGRSNTVDHHFACAHTSVMCVCCVCAFA